MKAIYLLATLGLLEQPATVNAVNLAAGVPGKWNKLPNEAAHALRDAWSDVGRLVAEGDGLAPEVQRSIEENIYGILAEDLSGRLSNEGETLSALDAMGLKAAWHAHHIREPKAENPEKAAKNLKEFEKAVLQLKHNANFTESMREDMKDCAWNTAWYFANI